MTKKEFEKILKENNVLSLTSFEYKKHTAKELQYLINSIKGVIK